MGVFAVTHRPSCEPIDPGTLTILARRLQSAREAVAEERLSGNGRPDLLIQARRTMLRALEDYIHALESHALPVPYALRDELRLHRQLFPH